MPQSANPNSPADNQNTATADTLDAVVNLSGYRFVALDHLALIQHDLDADLRATGVLGTILLAEEGINVALAGTREQIEAARAVLNKDPRFADLWLKESYSKQVPFSKLKVRMRHEIIAFDGEGAGLKQFDRPAAPDIEPETVQAWLDEGKNFTLLDTRNRYEIEAGTFETATDLKIDTFRHFQAAVKEALEKGEITLNEPMVTFCTGGVRCEKAAPWMIEQGFTDVYQIKGGIINYFEKTGGKHWKGDCFVFDDRVEVDMALAPTGTRWCNECQQRVTEAQGCNCIDGKEQIGTM